MIRVKKKKGGVMDLSDVGGGGGEGEGRGSMTAKGSESTLILFKLIIFCEISPRGSRFFRI